MDPKRADCLQRGKAPVQHSLRRALCLSAPGSCRMTPSCRATVAGSKANVPVPDVSEVGVAAGFPPPAPPRGEATFPSIGTCVPAFWYIYSAVRLWPLLRTGCCILLLPSSMNELKKNSTKIKILYLLVLESKCYPLFKWLLNRSPGDCGPAGRTRDGRVDQGCNVGNRKCGRGQGGLPGGPFSPDRGHKKGFLEEMTFRPRQRGRRRRGRRGD